MYGTQVEPLVLNTPDLTDVPINTRVSDPPHCGAEGLEASRCARVTDCEYTFGMRLRSCRQRQIASLAVSRRFSVSAHFRAELIAEEEDLSMTKRVPTTHSLKSPIRI